MCKLGESGERGDRDGEGERSGGGSKGEGSGMGVEWNGWEGEGWWKGLVVGVGGRGVGGGDEVSGWRR